MKLLTSATVLAILSACGVNSENSKLNDLVNYNNQAQPYRMSIEGVKIHITPCPKLMVAVDNNDLEKQCPNNENTRIFLEEDVKNTFENYLNNPSVDLIKAINKNSLKTKFRNRQLEIEALSKRKVNDIKDELEEAKEIIANINSEFQKKDLRRNELKTYAEQAGGENYLGDEYLKELHQLRDELFKLTKQREQIKMNTTMLQEDLDSTDHLSVAAKAKLNAWIFQPIRSEKIDTLSIGKSPVLSFLIRYAYENMISRNANIHMIGVYEASSDHYSFRDSGAPATVKITGKGSVVIVLASYEPVIWNLDVSKDITIEAVYRFGYYDQTVKGVSASKVKAKEYGYFYQDSGSNFAKIKSRVLIRSGLKDITSVQGDYNENKFTISNL